MVGCAQRMIRIGPFINSCTKSYDEVTSDQQNPIVETDNYMQITAQTEMMTAATYDVSRRINDYFHEAHALSRRYIAVWGWRQDVCKGPLGLIQASDTLDLLR